MTLSPENPENAKIYRHCYRPNSREEIASNRAALLIADNDVLLNGTEIIPEVTDRENRLSYRQSNIGYELTDDLYFQYRRLDRAIVDKAKVSTYPSYRDAFLDTVKQYQSSVYLTDLRKTIFEDEHSGTQFALVETH